jgi:hypothetical protein
VMRHRSSPIEEVNDRLDTLVQIGWASRNALRTRYTVAITPEAWEATYWTMVSIDTSNSLRLQTAASCQTLARHPRQRPIFHPSTSPTTSLSAKYWPARTSRRYSRVHSVWRGGGSLIVLAGFTTAMLVAFVTPRLGFSLICATLILRLRPEVPGFTNR